MELKAVVIFYAKYEVSHSELYTKIIGEPVTNWMEPEKVEKSLMRIKTSLAKALYKNETEARKAIEVQSQYLGSQCLDFKAAFDVAIRDLYDPDLRIARIPDPTLPEKLIKQYEKIGEREDENFCNKMDEMEQYYAPFDRNPIKKSKQEPTYHFQRNYTCHFRQS